MRVFFVVICLLLSTKSLADQTLEQLELLSYRLSSSFGAFIFFEGQQDYLQRAEQNLSRGSELLTHIEGQHPDIHKLWHQAEDFIEQNTHRSFEGVDMTLEASWSLLTLELQEKISKLTAQNYSSPAVKLQIELEQILVHYMKFANSTVGGYGVSLSHKTIEQRVADAQQLLNENFAKQRRLQRKWNYIKRTVLAYNSNTAPYIVIKVFDDMRELIRQPSESASALAAG